MSPYPPAGGDSSGSGGAPPHLQDDRAPPDLDPAIADAILILVNSHLDANRNFKNPTVLDDILKLIRNFDLADDIVDKVEKLWSEAETETATERPTNVQGSRLGHAPSGLDPAILDEIRRLDPAPSDPDQAVVVEKAGGEVRKLELKAEEDGGGEWEVEVEKRSDDWGESWKGYENGSDIWGQYEQSSGVGGQNESDEGGGDVEKAAESWSRTYQYYPVRPEDEDCSFYLKTGTFKFGSNCKFNHPVKRKSNQCKEREESAESPGQTEYKYYLRPGGCKYGKACRDIHSREKPTVAPVMDTNFAGLPIRPGEKECPYYMRHGECKYASNCRFSHPDPVAEHLIPRLDMIRAVLPYKVKNQVEEFPERPGQPVCSYFLRTGDCKFKSSCKYHHPKIQTAVFPSYTLSDEGLPLRPDQNIWHLQIWASL